MVVWAARHVSTDAAMEVPLMGVENETRKIPGKVYNILNILANIGLSNVR
jgi:hypothetical protein